MRIILILLFTISLVDCAGRRAANPVTTYQYGDEKMSCSDLETSIAEVDVQLPIKRRGMNHKGRNTTAFIVGLFLWPVWLAMDLSKDEGVEFNALHRRRESLIRIMVDNGCNEIPPEAKRGRL